MFGGSHGIRDKGLLESALARPLTGFGGHSVYTTPFARAATLAESIIQDDGFVDGNKRTGVMAMAAWLHQEGYSIEAERGEIRDLGLAIAEHKMSIEEVASWLEARAVLLSDRTIGDEGAFGKS
jgi:death-on-curing protein